MLECADLSADLVRIEIELAFVLKTLRPTRALALALRSTVESVQCAAAKARLLERLVLETPASGETSELEGVALSVLHPHAQRSTT